VLTHHRDFLLEIPDADLPIYDRVLPVKSPLLDALEMIPWDDFRPDTENFYCPDRG